MGTIYCITNTVNGKKYVGKTVQDPRDRWDDHVRLANTGKRIYFSNAIRKYGPDAFDLSILETTENEDLSGLERKWIAELKTFDHDLGYNSTEGGEGFSTGDLNPSRLNPRKGPDNWAYGRTLPEEIKEKISKTLTGLLVGEKNPFYGKKHSEETKRRISEIQIGQKRGPCSEEKKRKISQSQKGRILTEEHKAKLSAAKAGRTLSPEHKEKLKEAQRLRREREAREKTGVAA